MAGNQVEDAFGDDGDVGNPLLRWREYLHVLYERRWIAITTFFVVMTCAVVWNVRQIPIYRASSTLHVDMFASNVLNLPDLFSSGTPGYMFGQYINTQVKALKSRLFITRVVQSIESSDSLEAKAFLQRSSNPIGEILSSTSISAVENSRLIKITVQNPIAEVTALLANAIAEQFIEQDLHRRMDASLSAVKWLREQADVQKEKIEKAERAIQEYREKRNMVSLEKQQDIVVAKLKAVSESLTQSETVYMQSQAEWREIQRLWETGTDPGRIPAIAAVPLVAEAIKNISDLESQIDDLKLRYKSKHPILVKAISDLEKARASFTRSSLAAAMKINSDYKLAKANVEALRGTLKAQEQQALELSRMMVEYNALKRNAETDQQLYQNILVRMKETDLSGKLETSNIRINDMAHSPSSPFKPNKAKNILQAAAAGLVLSLMLVLVVHLMDDRVRRIEDFENSLGIPVLGMIPKIDLDALSERAHASFINQDSQVAEAFRGVHASIMLDSISRDAKVIMVVSSGASEGKSLVSSNLASIFAQNGKSTLIIDADLRRPTQHKLFKTQKGAGLPHLITEKASWEEALTHAKQPLLDLLTGTGLPSGNPARLIASDGMNRVLKVARTKYDRIIVDCPPLFGVSDPLVLLPKVDGVILVALYNRTHRRAVTEASQKLINSETPLLGAIINRVELTSHSYYYHRYGYNHYYGSDGKS